MLSDINPEADTLSKLEGGIGIPPSSRTCLCFSTANTTDPDTAEIKVSKK